MTNNYNSGPDATDRRILEALDANARIPLAELARSIGLSSPSTSERLRRLEERGVIARYTVEIPVAALGYGLSLVIRIRPMPGELARVAKLLVDCREIVQADRVTGDDCFIARAVVRDVQHMEELIDRFLPYAATNTAVIQSSPVSRRLPPLAGAS